MQPSKNKRTYFLSFSVLVVFLFILTAWRAVDDPGQNFTTQILPISDINGNCPVLPGMQWFSGTDEGGIFLPPGQDIGRMLVDPVITNATFPVAGDKLRTALDIAPAPSATIWFTPPGYDQTWDLSSLSPEVRKVTYFQPASVGSTFSNYPTADLVVIDGGGNETYYDVTESTVSLVGRFGYDELGLGLRLNFKYIPPLVERYAPLKFFDIHQSASNILTAFDASIAPPILLNLVPTADSFRIRITYQQIGAVDATGNILIPNHNYEVLRQKRTTYKSMAVDVKVAPLGWIDISTIGGQQLLPLGTDTITTHHFLNSNLKEPVALITLNTQQNAALRIEFSSDACLHVTSTLNTGLGSLREAVFCSLAGDTIRFDAGVFNQTIQIDLPAINTGHPLTLFGDPTQNITISNFNSGNTGVLMNIQDQLSISGLKITGLTPESMILKLDPGAELNLLNAEVSNLRLERN